MEQLTRAGLIKVFGHVSLILAVPIIGGAVAGLLLDGAFDTSPLYVLAGFAVGNLIAIIGLWMYVRVFQRRYAGPRDMEKHDS